MFRDPLLHLGAGLLARELAVHHLGVYGLSLRAELLHEGLLFRSGVGEALGAQSSAVTRTDTGPYTRLDAGAGSAAHPRDTAGSQSAESVRLREATVHPRLTSALALPLAHLLSVHKPVGFDGGEAIERREGPGLQGASTLRKSWNGGRGQRYRKT